MKTKGLVRAAILAIASAFTPFCVANDMLSVSDMEQMNLASEEASLMDYTVDGTIPDGKWYAGSEFTAYRVHAPTGGVLTGSFSDTTAPGVATTAFRSSGIKNDAYAPRFWVGRNLGDKWAVQARYWHLESALDRYAPDPNPNIPNTGSNFASIYNVSSVELYTIDVEAVRKFTPGAWKIDGIFGARHASYNSYNSTHSFGVYTTGNFVNLLLANGSSFDGTGLTTGLTGRRAIGNTCASLFVSGRGSYMWGHTDSFARAAGTVASSPSAPLVGAATVTRANADATTNIAEMQIGVQWDFELRCIPASAFFRTGFECQYWKLNGPPTGGAGFGGTIGELTTNSFASADLGEARLFGAMFGCGLNW